MSRVWIFQANPKMYDIDAALQSIDHIWWRVPQYTSEIHVGDIAVIWRSGKNAGVVGVSRVTEEPQLRDCVDDVERPFTLNDDADRATTRARLQVGPTAFVSKDRVATLARWGDHPIVSGPMGTVFVVTDEQWAELSPLVTDPPVAVTSNRNDAPPLFHWEQRAKSVQPMAGGYDGYLSSLRDICHIVDEERPAPDELPVRMQAVLGISATSARYRESFLRKLGVVQTASGVCRTSDWTRRWLESGDDRIIIELLHSRCQFIGELLDLCREPLSVDELRRLANERFGMRWDTNTQITNRRGWLQSAGMLEALDDRTLHLTADGTSLVEGLELRPPGEFPDFEPEPASELADVAVESVRDEFAPAAPLERAAPQHGDGIDALLTELRTSSTDSSNPDRFEQAVTEAFRFLGFRSEWLGKAGRTDVLLDAMLGKSDSYRAIVDCKTSGSGSVTDGQIDWLTLRDHRARHDADFVLVVAPSPTGKRLFERAQESDVAVMSAEQLIGVCRQHGRTPLGLDDYRELFSTGGSVETTAIDERAEELGRLMSLTAAVVATIRDRSESFGRLSARDLYLILADDPVADGSDEEQIQLVLDGLANPLVGVVDGDRATGYRLTSDAATARIRLDALARRIIAAD